MPSRSALALLALLPALASAEPPPAPYVQDNPGLSGFLDGSGVRIRTERDRGILVGDFLLWPGLIIEGRYDSNVFYEAEGTGEAPDAAPMMRIVPGLAIQNPHPGRIAFSLAANADIRLFFSDSEVVRQQQSTGANADLRADFFPHSIVTFSVSDAFRRVLETPNFSTTSTYNQNVNRAAAMLSVKPGGGALRVSLGYAFAFDLFDDFEAGDYMYHEARLLATWRFYPRTAALLEATGQLWSWLHGTDSGVFARRVDNNPLRVQVGLNGYVTKKIAALVKVGYGNSFHDSGESFSNVIGQAEVSYRFLPGVLAAAGFARDFTNSYYANYYTENRTYLRAQADLARRVRLDLSAAFHLIDFAEFDPAIPGVFISHRQRRDQAVTGHASVSVDLTRWVGLTLGYEARAQFTNFYIQETRLEDGAAVTSVDRGEYVKHQVYGSIDVRY